MNRQTTDRCSSHTLLASLLCGTAFLCGTAASGQWLEHGPRPNTLGQVEGITDREVVGAVHAVAPHPTNPDVIYVGAVNGGIWMTIDGTAAAPNWAPQLGLDQSLSIGAIAFDPTDVTHQTLLAGAGRFSSFGAGNDRTGAWRTIDGGAAWTALGGSTVGLNISGAAPRGANLVVSANSADSFGDRGIWRSPDTGASWTQISGAPGTGLPAGATYDLAGDPSDAARLYTNAGTSGIYRSLDTGATWTKVSDAGVDAVLAAGAHNVEISVGASNNVYVAIVTAGSLAGLFRSPNGAAPWTALDLPTTIESGVAVGIHPGGQGGTHLSITADLSNASVVYVGGDRQPYLNEFTTGTCPCFPNSIGALDYSGRLFRVDVSLPAGGQATHITHTNTAGGSSPHGDSRDMAIDANGDLLEVDDGGIYRRMAPLTNVGDWFSVIGNLATTELHSVAWDSVSKIAIGGAQDTGTPQEILPASQSWQSVATADGGDVAVDDTGVAGQSVRYSSNQYLGSFRRRTYDPANTFVSEVYPALTVVGGGAALTVQFYTPIEVNNVTPARLIIGGGSVYESLDQGDTITEIGPGIVVNGTGRDPIAYGAAGNADMLYVGSGDDVFVRSAAAPAALAASATYPGAGTFRDVLDIAIHPADPLTAFVVDETNVYWTDDAGATWTNVTGDLMTLAPGTLLSVAFSTSALAGTVIVGGNNGVFAADGPAFTTWTPAAPGLPRAPAYDLDYDAVDEVLVAGLLGRGAWTVSLAERDPVDVALVLDLSGSMLSPACPTCDPKLQVLKDAVELFVQLWTVFAIPDDRMGLNYFRTSISEFLPGGMPLFPVLANAQAMIDDVQSQTTTGTNLTAMGGGLQTAINRLTDATRPRNVILFTDGMQNVNPMVDTMTLEIDDEPGRPSSGVSPTVPPTDLDATLGRKVNTIGVGATPAFVNLLDDIAFETNGLFKLTTEPDDDLRQFYIEQLIDVLRTFSPQLVGYRHGVLAAAGASEVFSTDATARQVVFKVSWRRGEKKLDFSVEKDGVPLGRVGRFIDGPFYRIFVLDVPATSPGGPITADGEWRLRISGAEGTAYQAAAIVDEAALEYDVSVGGSDHVSGTPLPLSVELSLDGRPLGDARVTARVLSPQQGLGTLLSTRPSPAEPSGFVYEPQASAAQRKYELLLRDAEFRSALRPIPTEVTLQHVGAGNYSATWTDTALTGPYSVVFHVEGDRPEIGHYERTESRTVTVRFGQAVLSASDLRLRSLEHGQEGRDRYELTVRPVDAVGNYLGPDYGHRIVLRVNGTHVAGPPRDELDGSYVFAFTVASSATADVTLTVMEEPLYDGPLAGIPGATVGRFALSLHVGASVPVTGFPPGADPGWLGEVDLEWRLKSNVSLEGILGHYEFASAGEIDGFTLLGKWYAGASGKRLYAAAGPGLYEPNGGGGADLGVSVAAGLNRSIAPRNELDLGVGYTHVFEDSDAGFLALRIGVKRTF